MSKDFHGLGSIVFIRGEEPGVDKGDVDGNGFVNTLDVVLAVKMALGLYQPTQEERNRTDMNYDGETGVHDVVAIVNAILKVSHREVN